MNKGIVATLSFMFGAGAGAAVTYKLVKDKFARLADEEISEVREYYSQKNSQVENLASDEETEQEKAAERARDKVSIMEYAKEIQENRYSNDVDDEDDDSVIEYIDESELGEIEDYDLITLTYYSDGVLADEDDEEVDNFLDKVGNFTTHFDGDVVYVKNDDYQAYYEIIRDDRSYADVVGTNED